MPVVGTPEKRSRDLTRRFGDRAHVGHKGERFTYDELNKLFARNLTTYVFHDLALPGWKTANLDHAICHGNRVVIVDSKCWAPGRYWTRGDAVYRGFSRFEAAEEIRLPRIANELGEFLGMEVTVTPLVVIWPSHPGRISTRLPGLSLRLPGETAYCLGRNLGTVLRRLLGPVEEETPQRALELLAGLVRRKGKS